MMENDEAIENCALQILMICKNRIELQRVDIEVGSLSSNLITLKEAFVCLVIWRLLLILLAKLAKLASNNADKLALNHRLLRRHIDDN